jgi:hypothetical protein
MAKNAAMFNEETYPVKRSLSIKERGDWLKNQRTALRQSLTSTD